MKTLIFILCVLNIFFAIISFIPCMIGAAMGLDSPQAQKDLASNIIAMLILTFPLVCLLSGIALPILNHFNLNKTALVLGLIPLLEAASVVFFMYINGE